MSEPFLTLAEIAAHLRIAKISARRALEAGRFPNAVRDQGRSDGRWLIPWSDVEASGLRQPWTSQRASRTDLEAALKVIEVQAETIRQQAQTIANLTDRTQESTRTERGES